MTMPTDERLRRWRLILGGGDAGGAGFAVGSDDARMDEALAMLYDEDPAGSVGRGPSAPRVNRWLGDIRTYFPSSVVQLMQKDAIDRLGLKQLLLEPELLETIQPDAHMVATLLSLNKVMPETTRSTARMVVQKLVDDLMKRLAQPVRQAVSGSLNRSTRSMRPRFYEIDWNRTIRRNLKHYLPEYKTIVPEVRIGYGRRRSALRDIILCVDQSGSMTTSVIYSSIFAAVLASLPSLKTHLVVYDTSVADLTADLHDPVDLLFGAQLGGGNDTPKALDYCAGLVRRPHDTIFVLISDLYEGELSQEMIKRVGQLKATGMQFITLLALNDSGRPIFDARNAAEFAALGIPSFACTPDLFPDLMAAAINRQDIAAWAARQGIQTAAAIPG